MYPNSALAVWQLTLVALVPVVSLAVWLIAVFVAARAPGDRVRRASSVPDESAVPDKSTVPDDQKQRGQVAALPDRMRS